MKPEIETIKTGLKATWKPTDLDASSLEPMTPADLIRSMNKNLTEIKERLLAAKAAKLNGEDLSSFDQIDFDKIDENVEKVEALILKFCV